MVPNAATECTSISTAASDKKALRAAPRATPLAAHETMAPATAPNTATSATTLARRRLAPPRTPVRRRLARAVLALPRLRRGESLEGRLKDLTQGLQDS